MFIESVDDGSFADNGDIASSGCKLVVMMFFFDSPPKSAKSVVRTFLTLRRSIESRIE